jgi:PleD family two-component response regulator
MPQEKCSALTAYRSDQLPDQKMQTTDLAELTRRFKVLLVDDNDNDLYLTRKSLEKQTREVVSASSVNKAFDLITSQSFDVLLTDLHMPEPGVFRFQPLCGTVGTVSPTH